MPLISPLMPVSNIMLIDLAITLTELLMLQGYSFFCILFSAQWLQCTHGMVLYGMVWYTRV